MAIRAEVLCHSNEENRRSVDFQAARLKFELFEKFYLSLSDQAKIYLRGESKNYKASLTEIQTLILPVVKKICSECKSQCCRLTPFYLTGTVGCFNIVDYLLARCDTALPQPRYKNMVHDHCPFWDLGCTLPIDSRSFACVNFFCETLEANLNMEHVLDALEKTKAILTKFSLRKCMY